MSINQNDRTNECIVAAVQAGDNEAENMLQRNVIHQLRGILDQAPDADLRGQQPDSAPVIQRRG